MRWKVRVSFLPGTGRYFPIGPGRNTGNRVEVVVVVIPIHINQDVQVVQVVVQD